MWEFFYSNLPVCHIFKRHKRNVPLASTCTVYYLRRARDSQKKCVSLPFLCAVGLRFRILDALFMTSPWKDAPVVTTVCSTFATGADTYTSRTLFKLRNEYQKNWNNMRVVYVSAPVAKVQQTVVTTDASFHGEVIKRVSRILKHKPWKDAPLFVQLLLKVPFLQKIWSGSKKYAKSLS